MGWDVDVWQSANSHSIVRALPRRTKIVLRFANKGNDMPSSEPCKMWSGVGKVSRINEVAGRCGVDGQRCRFYSLGKEGR